jgi:hypothetical protein
MSNCSNFIDLAAAQCGVDVGFGKVILLFNTKNSFAKDELTVSEFNARMLSGTIVGVLKNWHTVAGAPVAEINVERPGSAEMKLIRPEILADVLTFEGNIGNRDVIDSLVKAGTIHGLVIDDMGNVFGERSLNVDGIDTMPLNFSGKTSTSLQSDNASDKTVSVTVRYLVKDLAMLAAGVEVEDVASKVKVDGQFVSGAVTLATSASLVIKLIDKYTQVAFDGALASGDVSVRTDTETATVSTATYADGVFTLALTGTAFSATGITNFYVKISADDCYMKETKFTVDETA